VEGPEFPLEPPKINKAFSKLNRRLEIKMGRKTTYPKRYKRYEYITFWQRQFFKL
jgi:hypothetical protein